METLNTRDAIIASRLEAIQTRNEVTVLLIKGISFSVSIISTMACSSFWSAVFWFFMSGAIVGLSLSLVIGLAYGLIDHLTDKQ